MYVPSLSQPSTGRKAVRRWCLPLSSAETPLPPLFCWTPIVGLFSKQCGGGRTECYERVYWAEYTNFLSLLQLPPHLAAWFEIEDVQRAKTERLIFCKDLKRHTHAHTKKITSHKKKITNCSVQERRQGKRHDSILFLWEMSSFECYFFLCYYLLQGENNENSQDMKHFAVPLLQTECVYSLLNKPSCH